MPKMVKKCGFCGYQNEQDVAQCEQCNSILPAHTVEYKMDKQRPMPKEQSDVPTSPSVPINAIEAAHFKPFIGIILLCIVLFIGHTIWQMYQKPKTEQIESTVQADQESERDGLIPQTNKNERHLSTAEYARKRNLSNKSLEAQSIKRAIEATEPTMSSFYDAFRIAQSSPRISLAPQLQHMIDLRNRMINSEMPGCAGEIKHRQIAGMNAVIDGFLSFMAQNENAAEMSFKAATKELNNANDARIQCAGEIVAAMQAAQ